MISAARKNGALAVPNAALRFSPDAKYIADGEAAPENSRCVWVLAGENKVRPVKVKTLINDGAWTAVEASEIKAGDVLITGVETAAAKSAVSTPFMPKMPQRKKGNAPAKK